MAQGPSPVETRKAAGAGVSSADPAVDEALRALRQRLDPPLRFARRAGAARLQGVEALVTQATEPARGALGDAFVTRLRELAHGVDALGDDEKLARLVALERELGRGPAPPAPAAPASTGAPALVGADVLGAPLRFLKSIGERRAAELAERGLVTVGDALALVPRTYEDRRTVARIGSLEEGVVAVVTGTVVASNAQGFGRGRRFEAVLDDGTGTLRLVYFHFKGAEMQKRFVRGALVTAVGEVQRFGARRQMVHPKTTVGDKSELLGGVHAVYSELGGMPGAQVARVVQAALDRALAAAADGALVDPLPADARARAKVVDLASALKEIHRPGDDVSAGQLAALVERRSAGHKRIAFEELFVFALAIELRRLAGARDEAPALVPADGRALDDEIERMLPFAPTGAQRRAIADVARDVGATRPMARLLQGDVGSGKTAVAAAAMLRAVRAGHQAALMAPTELLAEQHGRTLIRWLTPLSVRAEIVTGSMPKKARALAEARLRSRDIDVVIGTQALLSDSVTFSRLGLCVIDEQHRFGVVQRAALKKKGPDGKVPHLLVMTATPIPRSLALTLYGDLTMSILDEMPPGRSPVRTLVTADPRVVEGEIAAVLARGERAFVVYPLIDASEKLDAQAAADGYEELRARFGDQVALLHGRMDAKERDATMGRFSRGQIGVLVSTTVIEVGVDVPEATLMVVRDAERFGLAQLHQLRGRVGRSHRESRCVLVVGNGAGEDAAKRLRVLEETQDGFRIADADLEQRGPGDILGTRQSGLPSLAFADLARHAPLIEIAREIARETLARDAGLALAEHAGIRRLLAERYAARLELAAAG